jgi:hypothetical protein
MSDTDIVPCPDCGAEAQRVPCPFHRGGDCPACGGSGVWHYLCSAGCPLPPLGARRDGNELHVRVETPGLKRAEAEPMETLSQAADEARHTGHAKRGRCSMCAAGDMPRAGLHRGQHKCGNAVPCLACKGDLPEGEQCQACGRINAERLRKGY